MSIGSLFAGIGGFDLAAKWMGWRTAWVSEIEPYASAVLKKHFPEAPNHGDITQIKGEQVERVDILCGGFPCQDISVAGKGAGLDGARSGLWTHYARLIDEIRPRYVVIENSPRLRTLGLGRVLRDIAAVGYDAEWHCIPAYAVGAPHQRDRIWILAYPHSERITDSLFAGGAERSEEVAPSRSVAPVVASGGALRLRTKDVAHSSSGGQRADRGASGESRHSDIGGEGVFIDRWWASEPNVGRVVTGLPPAVDRLRCLGNAIVPQVAYVLFQAIEERERRLAA